MALDMSKIKLNSEEEVQKPSSSLLDFSKIKLEPKYSVAETAAIHGVAGVLPAAGGVAGMGLGISAATPLAAGATAIGGPLAGLAVEAGGALVGGFGGASAISAVQNAIMPESAKKALQQSEKDNPNTAFAAELAPNLLFFSPSGVTRGVRAAMAAGGAGIEAGRQAVSGEKLDFSKIVIGGVAGGVMAKPTKLGGKLAPSLVHPEVVAPTPEAVPTEAPPVDHVSAWKEQVQKEATDAQVTPIPQEGITEPSRPLTEAPKAVSGVILESDGTPAVTEVGKPRLARRDKDTGEIFYNPEAIKESYDSSTSTDRPHIKEKMRTPQEYEDFIITHEQEHAITKQNEGESTVDYEKRVNEKALEKVYAKRKLIEEHIGTETPEEFHARGKEILKTYGEEAAQKYSQEWQAYQKKNAVELPPTADRKSLEDVFYKLDTMKKADQSELITTAAKAKEQGVDEAMLKKFFMADDGHATLTSEEKATRDSLFKHLESEAEALAKKLGIELSTDYKQPRIRLWAPQTIKQNLNKKWEDLTRTEGAFADKMKDPRMDAEQERNLFVLEHPNGRREVIQLQEGRVIKWEKQKSSVLSQQKDLKVGDKIGDATIKEAGATEIMHHSPYKYSENGLINRYIRLNELRDQWRSKKLLESLVKSEDPNLAGIKMIGEDGRRAPIPEGWVAPKNIDKIPELAGRAYPPKIAAVLEDWAKEWDNGLYSRLTSALIKNMMLNPLPHIFNEVMHLYNMRGITGLITPTGAKRFMQTINPAVKDVIHQSDLYQQVMREGGSILGADVRNNQFIRDFLEKAGKDALTDPTLKKTIGEVALKVGLSPVDLYNGISKFSNKAMWVTRDVMYMQAIREFMLKNKGSTIRDAITSVERHMPAYRLPSEIMGSRNLSKVLGNPKIAVFSRYHYGMVKSIAETLKGLNYKNLATEAGKKEFSHSLDSVAAIAFALGVLYPMADKAAQVLMRDDKAETRRAGPYHLLYAAYEVKTGHKDPQAMLAPVLTVNPVTLTLGQLIANRELYSGKQIYHPDDRASLIARDLYKYGKKAVPQAGPMEQATTEEEGWKRVLAKQIDIKSKSLSARQREERNKKYLERARKGRETTARKAGY